MCWLLWLGFMVLISLNLYLRVIKYYQNEDFIFGALGLFGDKNKITMMKLSLHFQCCQVLFMFCYKYIKDMLWIMSAKTTLKRFKVLHVCHLKWLDSITNKERVDWQNNIYIIWVLKKCSLSVSRPTMFQMNKSQWLLDGLARKEWSNYINNLWRPPHGCCSYFFKCPAVMWSDWWDWLQFGI